MNILKLLVVALSLLIVAMPTAGTAFACTNVTNPSLTGPHIYEVANWQYANHNQAIYTNMHISTALADDYSTGGFVEQTLWEGTNDSGSYQNWVEAGYTDGWNKQNLFTYYMASRNLYQYHENQITSITPSVGTNMPIEIAYNGNNNWLVAFNNNVQTISTGSGPAPTISYNNPPYSYSQECGIESTSATSELWTTSCDSLTYWDLNGSSYTWGGTNPTNGSSVQLGNDCPGTVSWLTYGTKLQAALNTF